MDIQTLEQQLLEKDPEFRKVYKEYDLAFEIGQMITEARIIKGVTQKNLAAMANTTQSSVARAESGSHLPSLRFLKKIADSLKARLIVKLSFIEKFSVTTASSSTSTRQIGASMTVRRRGSQLLEYQLLLKSEPALTSGRAYHGG